MSDFSLILGYMKTSRHFFSNVILVKRIGGQWDFSKWSTESLVLVTSLYCHLAVPVLLLYRHIFSNNVLDWDSL